MKKHELFIKPLPAGQNFNSLASASYWSFFILLFLFEARFLGVGLTSEIQSVNQIGLELPEIHLPLPLKYRDESQPSTEGFGWGFSKWKARGSVIEHSCSWQSTSLVSSIQVVLHSHLTIVPGEPRPFSASFFGTLWAWCIDISASKTPIYIN